MPRYFAEFAYKGTAYHGWQVQDNAVSVQTIMEKAFEKLLRERIELTGAGRTDTGVHARQMFAHFNSQKEDLQKSDDAIFHLNCILPKDIAIKNFYPVRENAHARFDATSRSYEYHIVRKKDPFSSGFALEFRGELDVDKMNDAAKILFEFEDFSAFSKSNTQVKTNLCKITKAGWIVDQDKIIFYISANRFLRNMVRAITGTMLEIGRGKKSPEWMRDVILSADRSQAGASVPAEGLYLTEVIYPEEIFIK